MYANVYEKKGKGEGKFFGMTHMSKDLIDQRKLYQLNQSKRHQLENHTEMINDPNPRDQSN